VNTRQALGTADVLVNGGILGADPQTINGLGELYPERRRHSSVNIAVSRGRQFDVLKSRQRRPEWNLAPY